MLVFSGWRGSVRSYSISHGEFVRSPISCEMKIGYGEGRFQLCMLDLVFVVSRTMLFHMFAEMLILWLREQCMCFM